MRRAFALLGLFAGLLVAWLSLFPASALATVDGGCTATIGGVDVTRGHDSADTAVPLQSGEQIPVTGTSPERVGDLSYTVHVASGGVQVGSVTIAQDGLSWTGDVDLETISNATVGVFEVTAEVQNVSGQEICSGVAFICIEGRSPFTTAAGAGATALGVGGGILLVLALVRAPGMGAARSGIQGFAGGASAGLGGAVLLQQFCTLPLTAASAAGIPFAVGAAGAIGASVLRSTGTRAARRAARLRPRPAGAGGPAGEPTEVLERGAEHLEHAGEPGGREFVGSGHGAGGPAASGPAGSGGGGPGGSAGSGGGGPSPGPAGPGGGPPGGGPSPGPAGPIPPPADGGAIVPPVLPPKTDEDQICSNCGTANSPDSHFCTNCGSRLGP